jgi:hypothetical protein
MVKYYGRAKQRIGAVNTNQLGLKMSGCPSRVGRNPVNARYISHRVNCMNGTCGPVMIHGVPYYPNKFRNKFPYCVEKTSKCQAAAGGIGNINSPYYRTPQPGEKGCGIKHGHGAGHGHGKLGLILTGAQIEPGQIGDSVISGYLSASSPDPRDAAGNLQPNSFKEIPIFGVLLGSMASSSATKWKNNFEIAFKGSKIPDFNSVRITGEGIDYTLDKDKAETGELSVAGLVWKWPKFNTKNPEKLIGKYRISFN